MRGVIRPAPIDPVRARGLDLEHAPWVVPLAEFTPQRLKHAGLNVRASGLTELLAQRSESPSTAASSGDFARQLEGELTGGSKDASPQKGYVEDELSNVRLSLWLSEGSELNIPEDSSSGTEELPEDETSEPDPQTVCPEARPGTAQDRIENLIMLDWDDTLIPTTDVQQTEELLPTDPAYTEALDSLRRHGSIVEEVLRLASSYGRVCIVTLSQDPWVTHSIRRFMPDLEAVLEELSIEVIYASGTLSDVNIRGIAEDGVRSVGQALKSAAMRQLTRQATWKNVISIGDSMAEYYSAQDVTFRYKQKGRHGDVIECKCKAVKLQTKPNLDELSAELEVLLSWLPSIIDHDGDLHLDFEDLAAHTP